MSRKQQGGGFSLDGYVDVAERIREFREKHPEGSLQTVDWRPVEVEGNTFIVYQAAAYRTPDDARPGHGIAWEPFPGRTPYTRDSELQNAETSAWGRAIVAVLASSTQRIASAEEVRNRQADREAAPAPEVHEDRKARFEQMQTWAAAIPDDHPLAVEWEAWKKEHPGWFRANATTAFEDAWQLLSGLYQRFQAEAGAEAFDVAPEAVSPVAEARAALGANK